jgi:WD40 repeat protein/serine/threonine protein kinase
LVEELTASDPRTIGPYPLLARLGAGGMGTVYLGRSPGGRRVAVKIVKPELANDQTFRTRFRREVAAAQAVSGFYTAPVIDADPDAPQPWLATAYIEGPDLRSTVEEAGPLPVDTVRSLAAGLAEALTAIHRVGLIHRDLKPSNVLLAADGPRVIDFGIAKALDDVALTGEFVIGSTPYMSPEHVESGNIGPASDVFALGSTLVYASTGANPFGGGRPEVQLFRILNGEADLSAVPDELRELITHCLARDPDARPTPAQVIEEVTGDGGELPGVDWLPKAHQSVIADSQTPSTAGQRRPPTTTGGRAVGSARVVAQPAVDNSPPAMPNVDQAAPNVAPVAQNLGPTLQDAGPTLGQVPQGVGQAPYGVGQVPYGVGQVPYGVGQVPHGVGQVPAGGPSQRQPPVPAPTGDGRRLAVIGAAVTAAVVAAAVVAGVVLWAPWNHSSTPSKASTSTVPITGTTLAGHTEGVRAVAFGSGGKLLASGAADNAAWLWNVANRTALSAPLVGHTKWINAVAFDPDGKVLATASWDHTVRLWDIATRRQLGSPLTGHTGPVLSVAFSPNGKTLATAAGDKTVRLWDVATHTQLGSPLTGHTGWADGVAFSPDGLKLASSSRDGTVRLWDVATRTAIGTPLTGHVGKVNSVEFSPDGKTLVTSGEDKTVRIFDVTSHRQDGKPFLGHAGQVNDAVFSPDGLTLATVSDDRTLRLWDVATRKELGKPLTSQAKELTSVAFNPDGHTLATASLDRTVRIWDVKGYLVNRPR